MRWRTSATAKRPVGGSEEEGGGDLVAQWRKCCTFIGGVRMKGLWLRDSATLNLLNFELYIKDVPYEAKGGFL